LSTSQCGPSALSGRRKSELKEGTTGAGSSRSQLGPNLLAFMLAPISQFALHLNLPVNLRTITQLSTPTWLVHLTKMAAFLNNLFGGSKPSASPIPAGDSGKTLRANHMTQLTISRLCGFRWSSRPRARLFDVHHIHSKLHRAGLFPNWPRSSLHKMVQHP
jgi:hypothetical protein